MDEETSKKEDEISLIDLFAVLWQRKKMIIAITALGIVGVVLFSVISILMPPDTSPLPNIYTSVASLRIDNSSSQGGGIQSMVSNAVSSMGGLASFAGLGGLSGGATFSSFVLFLLESNTLLDSVVDEFDLIKRYGIKESPKAASRDALRKLLVGEFDDLSGVLSITFSDKDPVFASEVVNFTVDYLARRFDELGLDKNKRERENLSLNLSNTYQNILSLEEESRALERSVTSAPLMGRTIPAVTAELGRITMEIGAMRQIYTQLRVQEEVLRVSMDSETPVFQILERAEVPDRKSGPSRGLICIIVTFAAGFFAVFLAFAQNAISNIRKDPEAMSKIRGTDV